MAQQIELMSFLCQNYLIARAFVLFSALSFHSLSLRFYKWQDTAGNAISSNSFIHPQQHRLTYEMGARTGFNDILQDRTKRFTYFVPRDKAWVNSETIYPNALGKLSSMDYDLEVGVIGS